MQVFLTSPATNYVSLLHQHKAAGVETAYLQKTLGHSNRAMTEHYINETVEDPKNIEDQLMNALSIC